MTSLTHRMRVLRHMEQQALEQQERLSPRPSAEAIRAATEVEAEDRKQCDDPDDWLEWTPAYRLFIARKIDACFMGRR